MSIHGATNRAHTGNPEAPVPASPTPLVMVFESQTKTISLIFQGQRGTQISLMRNSGHSTLDPAAKGQAKQKAHRNPKEQCPIRTHGRSSLVRAKQSKPGRGSAMQHEKLCRQL